MTLQRIEEFEHRRDEARSGRNGGRRPPPLPCGTRPPRAAPPPR
jgi:hypothetical protein